jgi:hypothetical protein
MRWRDTRPSGYVVNHQRVPTATYLKLHRSTCYTLQGSGPGDNWTIAYAKSCSEDLEELRRWAERIGGALDPCRLCAP